MPFLAKVDSESIKKQLEEDENEDAQGSGGKKQVKELVTDEEIKDLIQPELFALNVPAIMEILFGLFCLLVALLYIGTGWVILDSGTNMSFAYSRMAIGFIFLILMSISFILAYSLILKKKFASIVGAGRGIALIIYFGWSVMDYRRLWNESESTSNPLVGDWIKSDYYENNMYVSLLLLIFVIILTLLMFRLLIADGHLSFMKRGEKNDEDDELEDSEPKDEPMIGREKKKDQVAAK
jgi:hypothetical protein